METPSSIIAVTPTSGDANGKATTLELPSLAFEWSLPDVDVSDFELFCGCNGLLPEWIAAGLDSFAGIGDCTRTGKCLPGLPVLPEAPESGCGGTLPESFFTGSESPEALPSFEYEGCGVLGVTFQFHVSGATGPDAFAEAGEDARAIK